MIKFSELSDMILEEASTKTLKVEDAKKELSVVKKVNKIEGIKGFEVDENKKSTITVNGNISTFKIKVVNGNDEEKILVIMKNGEKQFRSYLTD